MSAVSEPRSALLAPRLRPPPTTSTIDADHPYDPIRPPRRTPTGGRLQIGIGARLRSESLVAFDRNTQGGGFGDIGVPGGYFR